MGSFVLSPVSMPEVKGVPRNPRPASIKGMRIGTVDNTKPNFITFLDKIEELLISKYEVAAVHRYRKPGRTEGVAQEIIDDIKKKSV